MNNKSNEVLLACTIIRTIIIEIEIIKLVVLTKMIIIVIMIINNSNLQDIMKMMESWKQRNAIWHIQEKPKKRRLKY